MVATAARLSWVALTQPALAQRTDFVETFYPAGYLAIHNPAALYPAKDAEGYIGSEFDLTVHKLLPYVPQGALSIWMYSPLNAMLLAPFTAFPPGVALLVWEAITIVAMVAIGFLMRSERFRWWQLALFAFAFFPNYMMLQVGQAGILLGLLPVVLSYFFLSKGKSIPAGIAAGLTFLNPKYIAVAGLLMLVAMIKGDRKALPIFFATIAGIFGLCMLLASPSQTGAWCSAMKLAEQAFFDPRIQFRHYVITSLPALLILATPIDWRLSAKFFIYITSALVAGHCVYFFWCRRHSLPKEHAHALALILGFLLMPLLIPHLLYYDLCGLFVASVLLLALNNQAFKAIAMAIWIAIDLDYLAVVFMPDQMQPLLLMAVMVGAYVSVMKTAGKLYASSRS